MATESLPFARPSIGVEEEEAILGVLRSGWITTGKEALAFERDFASFLDPAGKEGIRCLAVNSATAGLHLALEALGVGPDSLVLLPSYTFTATAETARYLGAEVVFVDSCPESPLMDMADLAAKLAALSAGKDPYRPNAAIRASLAGRKPRVISAVHYGGLPCDMDRLKDIAQPCGLSTLEDAAHSFPSLVPGKGYAGTLGDIGVYSFYATKTMTCAEGGMIATRDPSLAERMSVMRLHGIDRPVWNRYTDTRASWDYDVVAPGYKYNLNDILAAMGRVQLARASGFLAERKSVAARYDEAFSTLKGIRCPESGPADARHLYPIQVEPDSGFGRDELARALQERGIGVSVHFRPLHTMSYWRTRYGLEPGDLPRSAALHSRSLSLPIWQGMKNDDIERVVDAVQSVVMGYS